MDRRAVASQVRVDPRWGACACPRRSAIDALRRLRLCVRDLDGLPAAARLLLEHLRERARASPRA
jgi:hypothetical protein